MSLSVVYMSMKFVWSINLSEGNKDPYWDNQKEATASQYEFYLQYFTGDLQGQLNKK